MSSDQFNLIRYPNGDVAIRGGVIVDSTSSTSRTNVGLVSFNGGSAPASDPTSNSFYPAPVLSGGSGRNIFIYQTGSQLDIPFGTFYPTSNSQWISGNGFNFAITVRLSDGKILINDSVGTVAIANTGSFYLNDRLQCSSARSSGGPGTSVKTVDLGTGTGNCSFQFLSSGPACIFTVIWNSINVINVIGSGTVSFNKSLSSPDDATVTVQSLAGSSWSYNLGCPGGGVAPYSPPALGAGQFSFTAASTTYGNSLNGGVPFTLNCVFENGIQGKTAKANSEDAIGPRLNFVQDGYNRYYESVYKIYEIVIKSTGAELRDSADVIAIRPPNAADPNNLTDPSGTYESTAYGISKFDYGETFYVDVQLDQSLSITGNHTYVLKYTSGILTGIEGPIFYAFDPLPNNSPTGKVIPVGTYDAATDTLLQIWEGPILLNTITDFGSQDIITTGTLSAGNVFSGTYTPTLTNITNLSASTAFSCQYMRVGNVVTVSGRLEMDPTSSSANTELQMSLPIASDFTSSQRCGGTFSASTTNVSNVGSIFADSTNNKAFFRFYSNISTNASFYFTFTYIVI